MLKKLLSVTGVIAFLFASLCSPFAAAQNKTVRGTVVDAAGQPVTGAVVMVVGNNRIATTTDVDGAFSLNVPAGANLSVESLGYKSQTFPVGNQTVFPVVLQEDVEMLE